VFQRHDENVIDLLLALMPAAALLLLQSGRAVADAVRSYLASRTCASADSLPTTQSRYEG